MTVDDVKGVSRFFQDYCHDTEITIEKGEFLQEGSDFRSYEWTQGRRMAVRCIVQDKNGDIPLPLENKEHLRGKTKNRLKHSFSKYNFFMHCF